MSVLVERGDGALGERRLGIARLARAPLWLTLPALAFLGVFLLVPLASIVVRSFEAFPDAYAVLGESPVYGRVLWSSVRIALMVTVVALLVGYPYAYIAARLTSRWHQVMLALVLLPFWSSLLVRTYSWVIWLQDEGVVNGALRAIGLGSLDLIRTEFAVVVGMAQVMLPFMVLPLYAAIRGIDPDLAKAAQGLGARPWTAWRRVVLPLTVPGILAGATLVFVLSLGFYITPALLGGPSQTMVSQMIANLVSVDYDYPTASALAVALLVVTFGVLGVGALIAGLMQRRRGAG